MLTVTAENSVTSSGRRILELWVFVFSDSVNAQQLCFIFTLRPKRSLYIILLSHFLENLLNFSGKVNWYSKSVKGPIIKGD